MSAPISSSLFFRIPHGVIPIQTTLLLDEEPAPKDQQAQTSWRTVPSQAAATCFTTPESTPLVKIQAPVVRAAFKRPLRKTLASLACRLKKDFVRQACDLLKLSCTTMNRDDQFRRSDLPDMLEERHDMRRVSIEAQSHILGLVGMWST